MVKDSQEDMSKETLDRLHMPLPPRPKVEGEGWSDELVTAGEDVIKGAIDQVKELDNTDTWTPRSSHLVEVKMRNNLLGLRAKAEPNRAYESIHELLQNIQKEKIDVKYEQQELPSHLYNPQDETQRYILMNRGNGTTVLQNSVDLLPKTEYFVFLSKARGKDPRFDKDSFYLRWSVDDLVDHYRQSPQELKKMVAMAAAELRGTQFALIAALLGKHLPLRSPDKPEIRNGTLLVMMADSLSDDAKNKEFEEQERIVFAAIDRQLSLFTEKLVSLVAVLDGVLTDDVIERMPTVDKTILLSRIKAVKNDLERVKTKFAEVMPFTLDEKGTQIDQLRLVDSDMRDVTQGIVDLFSTEPLKAA